MFGGGNRSPSRKSLHIQDGLDDLCCHVESAERRHDIGSLDALAQLGEEIDGDFNADISGFISRLHNSPLEMWGNMNAGNFVVQKSDMPFAVEREDADEDRDWEFSESVPVDVDET